LGVCGLDSTGSEQGPVAGYCECGDEPLSFCATELVSYKLVRSIGLQKGLLVHLLAQVYLFFKGVEEMNWLNNKSQTHYNNL
jgi:hypothetical protein